MSNMNISIRKALESDIDTILPIEENAFGTHHWSKQSFISEFSNNYSTYLVAEMPEKKIAGYGGYWRVIDEGHITTLAVSLNYRRRHIADILLYFLIQDAYKFSVKWLTLEVRASNIPAINLYKKFKFEQLGIRKKYYQDNNEDAIMFWTKNINDPSFKKNLNNIFINISQNNLNADILQY